MLVLAFSFVGEARADLVRLKNGRSIEGVIAGETDSSVVIDLGVGTMSVRKSEVESIERYDYRRQTAMRQAWQAKYFLNPEFTPASLRDLTQGFIRLEKLQTEAGRAVSRRESTRMDLAAKQRQYEQDLARLKDVSARLKNADPGADVKSYNIMVSELNSLNASLALLVPEINSLNVSLAGTDKEPQEYLTALRDFKSELADRRRQVRSSGDVLVLEQEVLERLTVETAKFDADVSRYEINGSKETNSIVVAVLLNDRVNVHLMVDTGASSVVISRVAASRLGLDLEKAPLIEATLADGKKVKGRAVYLESVAVDKAQVKNVACAVLDEAPLPGLDGLLGMTFLEHFSVVIDSQSGKLILEELNRHE